MAPHNSGDRNDSENSSNNSEAVDRNGREEDSAGRSGEQVMSPPVEAVVRFGYPPDLVLSTYRQLQAARARPDSRLAQSPFTGSPEAAMTGSLPSSSEGAVTAAALMLAVDAAVERHSGTVAGSFGGAGLGVESGASFSAVTSSASGEARSGKLQPMPGEERGALGAEDAERYMEDGDEAPSSMTSRQHSEGQQLPVQGLAENSTPLASSTSNGDTVASQPDDVPEASATAEVAEPRQLDCAPSSVTSPPESTATSRDRSPQRSEENAAAAAADGASERRQQLKRLRALRAENRRLKARQTCRLCREKPVSLTLLPCGHFCLCENCGSSSEICPVCKKTVLADVKTFLS